jgi:hypothetical protein
MNREEAIYFANSLKNNYTVDLNDMEAFCDMAIKALAQESTTKNDSSELEKNSKKLEKGITKNDLGADCISRADALALYCDKCGLYNCISKCASYRAVEKMPSVTPQPKKGHWIESDYGNMITQHRWYCSECGGIHNDPESGKWREVFDFKYDYCPLCGADMREVEE